MAMKLYNDINIFDIAKEIRQSLGISDTYKPRELAQAIHNAVAKYKQNNPTSTVTNGVLTNAYDVPLQSLKPTGNSTQETRSGHQLFDKNNANIIPGYAITNVETGWYREDGDYIVWIPCKSNTNYTVSKINSDRLRVATSVDNPNNLPQLSQITFPSDMTQCTILTNSTANYLYVFYRRHSDTLTEEEIRNSIMINEGSSALPWEPYGVSPSPEYPSEIKSVGDKTKNLFDGKTASGDVNGGFQVSFTNGTLKVNSNNLSIVTGIYYIINVNQNTNYTISGNIVGGSSTTRIAVQYKLNDASSWENYENISTVLGGFSKTISSGNYTKIRILFYCWTSEVEEAIEAVFSNIQVEQGSQATSYEPYGYKVPVVVSGKNKLQTTENYQERTLFGVTATINLDGTITLNGTATRATEFYLIRKNLDSYELKANRNYYLVSKVISGTANEVLIAYHVNGSVATFSTEIKNLGQSSSVRILDNIRVFVNAGVTFTNAKIGLMLVEDIADTTYEPYHTPIVNTLYLDEPLRGIGDAKDELDFARRKVVRKVGQDILNGSETGWGGGYGGQNFFAYIELSNYKYISSADNFISSHFIKAQIASSTTDIGMLPVSATQFRFRNGITTDLPAFKNWLSTHNTEVIYELATPTETDFTSEQNAIADEIMYTKLWEGTNIITLGTEVQPSEINATYIEKVGV